MKWANSLIRISNYEVETLQKRLGEIVAQRVAYEMRLASLDAEEEAEAHLARQNAEAGIYMLGFKRGVQIRREQLLLEMAQVQIEEEGARDALSEAFESLKKFEKVAENAKLAERVQEERRETAQFDELGLRKKKA